MSGGTPVARVTDDALRSPLGLALVVLIPLGITLLPLVPAARAVLHLGPAPVGVAMAWFVVVVLTCTALHRRFPRGTRGFAIVDSTETVLVQAAPISLVIASGRGDTFFWMLWLFHVAVLAQYAATPRFTAGVLVAMILATAGAFAFGWRRLDGAVLALCVGALGLHVYWLGVQVARRLEAADAERARLAAELADVRVRQERERIARDIHDGLGADLAALDWRLRSLRPPGEGHASAALAGEIDELVARLGHGAGELRAIVWALRTPSRRWDELVAYLRQRTAELCGERLAHAVHDAGDGGVPARPGEAAIAYLRAVLELVHNAVRHAGATRVEVHLSATPGELRAVVEDDGRGVPAAALTRDEGGLANLRARAARGGGRVEIAAREGGGARITLALPATA